MLLQSKLADTSMSFKDVLEVRTQVRVTRLAVQLSFQHLLQNMKESKDRTEQFMYSAASAAAPTPSSPYDFHALIPHPYPYGLNHRLDAVQSAKK